MIFVVLSQHVLVYYRCDVAWIAYVCIWSGRNTLPPSSGRNEKDEYSIIEHVKLVVNKLYYQLSIICQKRIRQKNDAKKGNLPQNIVL